MNSIIGRMVEIIIDKEESGDLGRFNKIVGRVRGRIRDRKGITYAVVESLTPRELQSGSSAKSRGDSEYFIVAPKALGETLDHALKMHDDSFPVGIGRVLDSSILDSDVFDYSEAEYIAVGYLKFLNP